MMRLCFWRMRVQENVGVWDEKNEGDAFVDCDERVKMKVENRSRKWKLRMDVIKCRRMEGRKRVLFSKIQEFICIMYHQHIKQHFMPYSMQDVPVLAVLSMASKNHRPSPSPLFFSFPFTLPPLHHSTQIHPYLSFYSLTLIIHFTFFHFFNQIKV